ncbi:MAG: MerR family transcriptional regulator [Clostridia bacterium]|nr:MerR family transcriptional regulator [Clostridia bacterium]
MYSMKEVCNKLNLNYETLKFYCNQGLLPTVKRDANNRRIFDDHDIAWLQSLLDLKKCGMNHEQIRMFIDLCAQGKETIPQRKAILVQKRHDLEQHIHEIHQTFAYIDYCIHWYDDMLDGKVPYHSDLVRPTHPQEGAEK